MSFSRDNLKKYFFPVYYVWVIISPSIILLINPIPRNVVPAFYALFGLIWPLTFIVYPAFLLSINEQNTTLNVFSIDIAKPLFFIAWLGPVVHLIFAMIQHKKYISQKQNNENMGWGEYLSGFI